MNALDLETLTALHDRLGELAADEEARVVVLTGAGNRAFVAGADIKYMSGLSVLEAREWGGLGHACAGLLETMRKPTIASTRGHGTPLPSRSRASTPGPQSSKSRPGPSIRYPDCAPPGFGHAGEHPTTRSFIA